MKTDGLLLVLDGYNRIPDEAKSSTVTQIRDMSRDFPKFKFCLFTSNTQIPDGISENLLELKEFDRKELNELADLYELPAIWSGAPRAIMQMAKVPALDTKIVEIFQKESRFPERIDEVFEHWLKLGLSDFNLIDKALVSAFLGVISKKTLNESISLTDLRNIASDLDISDSNLEKIIDSGLLDINGNSVEPVHE